MTLPVVVRRAEAGGALSRPILGRPILGRPILGRLAQGLPLAAAPAFAFMAIGLAAAGGGRPPLCSAASAGPFGGMVFMYLLMAIFHAAPWLKSLARVQG